MTDKIILTGIKPTGTPHLGNYVGALKPLIEMANENKTFIFIADLHALNTMKNPAILCVPVTGDMIAISGSNDKLLIFPTEQIPEMSRGKGVILQKYNADRTYVLDVMFFNSVDGFGWTTGRGTTKLDDISPWTAKRASQGRTIPVGFPRSGRFNK